MSMNGCMSKSVNHIVTINVGFSMMHFRRQNGWMSKKLLSQSKFTSLSNDASSSKMLFANGSSLGTSSNLRTPQIFTPKTPILASQRDYLSGFWNFQWWMHGSGHRSELQNFREWFAQTFEFLCFRRRIVNGMDSCWIGRMHDHNCHCKTFNRSQGLE